MWRKSAENLGKIWSENSKAAESLHKVSSKIRNLMIHPEENVSSSILPSLPDSETCSFFLCQMWWVEEKGQPRNADTIWACCLHYSTTVTYKGKYHLDSSLFNRYSGHGRALSHIKTSSSYAHTELRKRTHTLCFGARQRKLRTCTFVSSYHLSSCSPQAQATLSAAVGLTMPQHTQHFLVSVLLLWTTILSIVQFAFIIIYFTAGHHSPVRQNEFTILRSL